MTTEEKVKELILQRYRSIREFTQVINMSYSTMDSILKRGIENASITNVIKICKELGISADELADGRVVPINTVLQSRPRMTEVTEIIGFVRASIVECDNLTMDGKPLRKEEKQLIINTLDISIELARRSMAH